MSETNQNQQTKTEALPMSGDQIIQNPDVAYDTTVTLPIDAVRAWSGRFGITRMGEVGNGYAGPLLPQRYDPILNEELRSLPADAEEPKRLSVGDEITDGKGPVRVLEIDDENQIILFESIYPSEGGKEPMHYTWQIKVSEGDEPNSAVVFSRTRMENLQHPKLGRFLWPKVDKTAMKILGEGIARDDSDTSKQPLKKRIGTKALAAAGKARAYKKSRAQK